MNRLNIFHIRRDSHEISCPRLPHAAAEVPSVDSLSGRDITKITHKRTNQRLKNVNVEKEPQLLCNHSDPISLISFACVLSSS